MTSSVDAGRRVPNGGPRRAAGNRRKWTGEHTLAWVLLAPSIVVFVVFLIYPLLYTVYLSLHANDIVGNPSAFVGLEQFTEMMTPEFAKIFANTLIFTVGTVAPGVAGALLIVLLLEARIRARKMFRTGFALPFAFSVASASVVFSVFYNPASGVLNGILYRFDMPPVEWLTSADLAMWSIILTTVWMNLGYGVLVLSAGLGAIQPDIIEAARIDGATGHRLSWHILVPLLGPQLFFLIVLSTINALQGFGQIHILTKGGPADETTTLVYSIYQEAFATGTANFGGASAQALVLFLIVLVCTAVQFGVIERKVHYS